MKCQCCGGNLNIEDKFCPQCGILNPFAVKHQEEMERYEHDYRQTKEDMLKRSSIYNRRNLKITIIAVLITLIVACAFVFQSADDIRWSMKEKSIASNAETYRNNINRFIEDEDYLSLYAYIDTNRIIYSDNFLEYGGVFDTTRQYNYIYDDLMTLQSKRAGSGKFSYTSTSELIEGIADKIHNLYKMTEPNKFNPEAFQGDKKKYMDSLKSHLEVLISGYFGLSLEDAAKMSELSTSKICLLLEEGYEK